MNDRELLELAAKAAGISFFVDSRGREMQMHGGLMPAPWNPLTDDSDALRLAVRLGLRLDIDPCGTWVIKGKMSFLTPLDAASGAEAVTRRAITRAAAEIGRAL